MRFHRSTPALALLLATALGASPAFAQSVPPRADPELPDPPAPPPPPPLPKKPMLISGIVVTALGAGLLVGGGALVGYARSLPNDDIDALVPGLSGTLMMVFGGIHALVGTNLILVGAIPPRPPAVASLPALPAIAVGPRSVTMRWVF